jgi:predicted dehydrogenase
MSKVTWGVLSTAKIGLDRVIAPMRNAPNLSIDAIASRDFEKAKAAAAQFGIARAYGSYEELLADPAIEAIYIPVPNHMHVEWAERAAAAGKHVLLEKPLAMNADEGKRLIAAREKSGKVIVEGFMVRYSTLWRGIRKILAEGRLGDVRGVQAHATYVNLDPQNIRNRLDAGGGALMDIGCYVILFARLIFGAEPKRLVSLIDRDPAMKTDRTGSLILDFPQGQATLFVSTQLARAQRLRIFGAKGSLEVEVPINIPDDRPMRVRFDDGRDSWGTGSELIEFPAANFFTQQGEAVSRAIRGEMPVEMTLEDSIANMRVIDAAKRSEKSGGWEKVG